MTEKRKHKRHEVRLNLFCQSFGGAFRHFVSGTTVNVSTRGMYFETSGSHFSEGQMVSVSLFVPPMSGILEPGGTMFGIGRVLRTEPPHHDAAAEKRNNRHGVAIELVNPLRLQH